MKIKITQVFKERKNCGGKKHFEKLNLKKSLPI